MITSTARGRFSGSSRRRDAGERTVIALPFGIDVFWFLVLAGDLGGAGGGAAAGDLRAEPDDGVVLAPGDAFFHRDERVVGDLDVLGADLCAALGDVAVAEPEVLLRDHAAVGRVGGVHLELGDPHQEPGAGERALVLGMVTDDVAGVLAQVALDALAEFL